MDVLNELKDKYLGMTQSLGLSTAHEILSKLIYSQEVIKRMSDFVFGLGAPQTDQEVEVEKDIEMEKSKEVDNETETENETELEKQADVQEDIPLFLPWEDLHAVNYAVHPLKDALLRMTRR